MGETTWEKWEQTTLFSSFYCKEEPRNGTVDGERWSRKDFLGWGHRPSVEVWRSHPWKAAVHVSVVTKEATSYHFPWTWTFQNQSYFQEELCTYNTLELVCFKLIYSPLWRYSIIVTIFVVYISSQLLSCKNVHFRPLGHLGYSFNKYLLKLYIARGPVSLGIKQTCAQTFQILESSGCSSY